MKKEFKLLAIFLLMAFSLILAFNFQKIKLGLDLARSYRTSNIEEIEGLTEDEISLLEGEGNPLDKALEDPASNGEYLHTIEAFEGDFNQIQDSFEAELNDLIVAGYREFQAGEPVQKLANKYLGQTLDLEKEYDQKFYQRLDSLEKELKDQGQDRKVIRELEDYYLAYKEARKSELLNILKEYL